MLQFMMLEILIIFGTIVFAEGQVSEDKINYKTNSSLSSHIPAGACRIGQLPKNGWIEYVNPSHRKLTADDYVSSFTNVYYKCTENHFLDGPAVNTCFNEKWVITTLPECKTYCNYAAISSASFVATNCYHNNISVECSQPAPPGTTAHINCREMYERDSDSVQVSFCGEDGIWVPPPEECSMSCGIKTQNQTTFVHITESDGSYVLGTIINARMVLGPGWYLYDTDEKKHNLSRWHVEIETTDDIISQRIEIERVSYAPNFDKSVFRVTGGICVLHLRTSIEFTYVIPVCLPYELSADVAVLPRTRIYREKEYVLQPSADCFSGWNSSSNAKPQITKDIFCFGPAPTRGGRLAPGSPLIDSIKENGKTVFYMYGMHLDYYEDNIGRYYAYLNIQFYKEFIQSEISYQNEKHPKTASITISSSFLYKTGRCRADNIPHSGNAYYESNLDKIEYGEVIENLVGIVYRCIENHVLYGNSTNFCLDGAWISPKPECKPRCNPMEIQGWTLVANCQFQENNTLRQTSCTEPASPGTIASINCEKGYERYGLHQQTATCGADGRWSPLPEKCTAVCGEISQGGAFIVAGQRIDISKVPWHAGIYREYRENYGLEQICGGSILTVKVIVSAMHCFWDPSEDRIHNKEEYEVAVGKSRRQLEAHEDFKPQFFKIENIFYEEGYNDYAGNYVNDIAVLILDKYIAFKSYIAPVCIHFGLEYDDKIVESGLIGKVAGWGLEQTGGKSSPTLKEIQLPVISRKNCLMQATNDFRKFITSDKFCAGYLTGVGVCVGDSGGGLVFLQTVGTKTVYFLRGIVSTGENKQGSCDNDKYSTFTNIAYYTDLIKKYYLQYQPNL